MEFYSWRLLVNVAVFECLIFHEYSQTSIEVIPQAQKQVRSVSIKGIVSKEIATRE